MINTDSAGQNIFVVVFTKIDVGVGPILLVFGFELVFGVGAGDWICGWTIPGCSCRVRLSDSARWPGSVRKTLYPTVYEIHRFSDENYTFLPAVSDYRNANLPEVWKAGYSESLRLKYTLCFDILPLKSDDFRLLRNSSRRTLSIEPGRRFFRRLLGRISCSNLRSSIYAEDRNFWNSRYCGFRCRLSCGLQPRATRYTIRCRRQHVPVLLPVWELAGYGAARA